MRKFYYVVCVPVKGTFTAPTPKCQLASACGYIRKVADEIRKERTADYPEYEFWVGWGWRGNNQCMQEVLKMEKFIKED